MPVSDDQIKTLMDQWLTCPLTPLMHELITQLKFAIHRSRLEFDGHAEVFFREHPHIMIPAVWIARTNGVGARA